MFVVVFALVSIMSYAQFNPPDGYYPAYGEKYRKYLEQYKVRTEKFQNYKYKLLSYEDWCDDNNVYAYKKVKTNSVYKAYDNIPVRPGDYLILARNQILIGIGIQISGGMVCTVGAINSNKDAVYVGYALILSGFVTEMIGFNNIGRAGISLNENGVGVKIKF